MGIKFNIAFKELKTVPARNKQCMIAKKKVCEFYIIMVDLAKTSI